MALGKDYKWIKVAASENELGLGAAGLTEIIAGDKRICIAKYKDGLFAFAASCPHAGGLLAAGFIDALGNVVCPLHRYRFCMKNGRNVSGEGYYLKHWPVEIKEDGVFVGFEGKSFLGLF